MTRLLSLPWLHAGLLAAYPALYLYAINTSDVSAIAALRPMLVCACASAIAAAILGKITRKPDATGLAVALLLAAFYVLWGPMLGPVVFALGEALGVGVRYVFAAYCLIVFTLAVLVVWRGLTSGRTTRVMNALAVLLCGMATGQLVFSFATTARGEPAGGIVPVPESLADAEATHRPDLYFLVLDAYGREDTLREVFGFDNSDFLNAMRERGFQIASKAHSPYERTNHSLPACVNMTYLETMAEMIPGYHELNPRTLYRDAVLHRVLRKQGYHLAACETRDPLSEPDDSFDTILRYAPGMTELSRFELKLLDFTPLPRVLRLFGINPGYDLWRGRILHMLENLDEPADQQDAPVYQQAHLICPHRPFVFDADGSASNPDTAFSLVARPGMDPPFEQLAQQYIRNLQGLNVHVLDTVDRILANAREEPPVIVVTSDHGPPFQTVYEEGRKNTLLLIHAPNEAKLPNDLNLVELWPWVLRTQLGLPVAMPEAMPASSASE